MTVRVRLVVETLDGEIEIERVDPLTTFDASPLAIASRLTQEAREEALAALRVREGLAP